MNRDINQRGVMGPSPRMPRFRDLNVRRKIKSGELAWDDIERASEFFLSNAPGCGIAWEPKGQNT